MDREEEEEAELKRSSALSVDTRACNLGRYDIETL
jgi:hypothetical protein